MVSQRLHLQVGRWIMKPASGLSRAGLQMAVDCDVKRLGALREVCVAEV